ncbi:MAG: TolC family protein [Chlamydiota bacterium]|nr:TolC family protein [Chlamydiota bacterium]
MMFSRTMSIFMGLCFLIIPAFSRGSTEEYLEQLIMEALQRSDQLQLLEEDIARAENELKNAKSFYWPRLSLQGSAGVDLLHLDAFSTDRNLGSNLILDWDFFQNGMVKYRIEYAAAQLQMVKNDVANTRLDLYFQLKNNFFDLFEKKERLHLMQQEYRLKEIAFERVKIEIEQGQRPRIDLLKEKAKLMDDQIRFEKTEREFAFLVKKLEGETGANDLSSFALDMTDIDEPAELDKNMITDLALEERIDIKDTKIQIDLALKAYRVAKWKRWPSVNIFAGNAFALDDLGASNDRFQFRTGLIARYSIYDGGERSLQIKVAGLQLKKAKLKLKQVIRKAKEDIELALDELRNSRELMHSGELQYRIIQDDLEREKIDLEHHKISNYDWDEAMLSVEQFKVRQISLYLNYLRAGIQLSKAVGVYRLKDSDSLSIKEQS